ncbi:MAG: hypothetical protein IMF01_08570 [Proteobacteria bacterium]|nr:hypothetical protein [Pseudomonadota bacterium]
MKSFYNKSYQALVFITTEILKKVYEGSHEDFVKIMAEVCDQLINKYKAKIVFVPHVREVNRLGPN